MHSIETYIQHTSADSLLGIVLLLAAVWTICYVIPEMGVLLVSSWMGNLLCLLSLVYLYKVHSPYVVAVGVVYVLLLRYYVLARSTEAFSGDSVANFMRIQQSINRNIAFDVDYMEETGQITQKDLDYFNEHGQWFWSDATVALYEDAVARNTLIQTLPSSSVKYAQTVYNEAAILRILAMQSKEGHMMLHGVRVPPVDGIASSPEQLPSGMGEFPYTSGEQKDLRSDVIRCNLRTGRGMPGLERVHYTGKHPWYGWQTEQVSEVDYRNLESEVPGFSFVREPCNPCAGMAADADYTCPFRLRTRQDSGISSIWSYLWGV